jgi:hypothetical protein
MSVSLSITIASPLTKEDHELLAGIAMMTLAIANHEGAIENTEEEKEEEKALPEPCGFVSEEGMVCVSKSGHRGRHAMRPNPNAADAALPN